MKHLGRDLDLDHFFDALRRNPRRGLLLDYDGTLAPFREERDQAFPYPGVRSILDDIIRTESTRVAIITGRAVRDVLPLLGLERRPEIRGSHGWEILGQDAVDAILAPMKSEQRRALDACREWLGRAFDSARVEDKPASVALHWRGLDESRRNEARTCGRNGLAPIAQSGGLILHEFDGGIEVRVPGRDKGTSAAEFLSELGHGCAVACLGDDRTDEDMFEAVAGSGLRVLVREEPRPTLADLWLRPPEELIGFLARWRDSVSG